MFSLSRMQNTRWLNANTVNFAQPGNRKRRKSAFCVLSQWEKKKKKKGCFCLSRIICPAARLSSATFCLCRQKELITVFASNRWSQFSSRTLRLPVSVFAQWPAMHTGLGLGTRAAAVLVLVCSAFGGKTRPACTKTAVHDKRKVTWFCPA